LVLIWRGTKLVNVHKNWDLIEQK